MFDLYWEYYIMGIILLPAIILAAYAQSKVSSTYNKFSRVASQKGMRACEMARLLLDCADLKNVEVIKINGHLTDYYDHKKQVVALSASNYESTSIAALGVAAHEVGHALQYKNDYLPIKLRSFIIPIVNFSSTALWPLVLIGLMCNFAVIPGTIFGNIFLWSGVAMFGLAAIFDLITLPCEYNASNRALQLLEQTEILTSEETQGAKKVLSAAALTYVASLLNSILNLVRFILVFLMHAKRDD